MELTCPLIDDHNVVASPLSGTINTIHFNIRCPAGSSCNRWVIAAFRFDPYLHCLCSIFKVQKIRPFMK